MRIADASYWCEIAELDLNYVIDGHDRRWAVVDNGGGFYRSACNVRGLSRRNLIIVSAGTRSSCPLAGTALESPAAPTPVAAPLAPAITPMTVPCTGAPMVSAVPRFTAIAGLIFSTTSAVMTAYRRPAMVID